MTDLMKPYDDLLKKILERSSKRSDRTNTGTLSVFGEQVEFDVDYDHFPLLTTRRISMKTVTSEWYWIQSGQTNVSGLHEHGNHIWDAWADDKGDLGPVYGKQMRNFEGVDQLEEFVSGIHESPYSRRHLMVLWNPKDVGRMALPPCHGVVIQAYVDGSNLDLKMYQRSWDVPVGGPFNIAEYALFLCLLCRELEYKPGRLIITTGDSHIYSNQVEGVGELLEREHYPAPKLVIDPELQFVADWKPEHISLEGYNHHPHIKFPVAV